ncbi:MAG: hypothetical protein LBU47_07580 [Christensenellaceae bacterium]|jgi:L-ascorbate metabolism protein UlaG (beta-lactamase superfamily)|nr:hypothetical protein [Christensenellaceae bacterium]
MSFSLRWLGCATLLACLGGERFCFDPFLPLPGAENPLSQADFAGVKRFFLSHGHIDHRLGLPGLLQRGALVYSGALPQKGLLKAGVLEEKLRLIAAGERLSFGGVELCALRGSHVRFDAPLVLTTMLSPRMLRFRRNAAFLLRAQRHYPKGETLAFELSHEGKRLQILGSLGLGGELRPGADCLVLPYQGRSDLPRAALPIVEALRPKALFLDHFDDAFPPLSRRVDPEPFLLQLKKRFPEIRAILPRAREDYWF